MRWDGVVCGRFALDARTDDLIREFVAAGGRAEDWVSTFSVAPTEAAPIIRPDRQDVDQRRIELARWGFTPAWAKAGDRRPTPFNARLETIATNGMFRSAFRAQRCIVPMTGYYEWVTQDGGKQPHFIRAGRSRILAAAGLYAVRRDGEGWSTTFTVVTTRGRDASGAIHDRMPVFLTQAVVDEWLSPAPESSEALIAIAEASAGEVAGELVTFEVSRRVNGTRGLDRHDRALAEPLAH